MLQKNIFILLEKNWQPIFTKRHVSMLNITFLFFFLRYVHSLSEHCVQGGEIAFGRHNVHGQLGKLFFFSKFG